MNISLDLAASHWTAEPAGVDRLGLEIGTVRVSPLPWEIFIIASAMAGMLVTEVWSPNATAAAPAWLSFQ